MIACAPLAPEASAAKISYESCTAHQLFLCRSPFPVHGSRRRAGIDGCQLSTRGTNRQAAEGGWRCCGVLALVTCNNLLLNEEYCLLSAFLQFHLLAASGKSEIRSLSRPQSPTKTSFQIRILDQSPSRDHLVKFYGHLSTCICPFPCCNTDGVS